MADESKPELCSTGRAYATVPEADRAWSKARGTVRHTGKKYIKRHALAFPDPRGGSGKVVLLTNLPADVRAEVLRQNSGPRSTRAESPLAPRLPFTPHSSELASYAPPGEDHKAVMRKLQIAIESGSTSALAEKYGLSPSTIGNIKREAQAILENPSIEDKWAAIARGFIPRKHPGQEAKQYFAEAAKADDFLKILRECGGRITRAWEIYCASLPEGENPPTLRQCRRFVKRAPLTERLRGRLAVKVAAGYIDGHYDDAFAGDAWCIDEWQVDGVFYDEQDRSRLFNYGEKGPVAHILSIMDERTTYIMDWILTWNISLEEATLELAERLVRRHWLPVRLVTDRAGRFRALSRQGRVIVCGRGELVDNLMGPLGELGVKPRGGEEENPRGNRIERAAHREYARRAVDFGISWKGANTREREGTDIDARVKRHLREHCKLGACGPQLLSIQEAERIIARWVNELNTCKTRAKGCHGLTRLAAFNQFRPTDWVIARRKPSEALLDLAFAERDQRTIQPGGVIELKDGKRYSDFELVGWVGEKVEVLRYRREPSTLQVFAPGQEGPVIAHLRRAVGRNEPAVLSEQIAKVQHARKILAREETPLPAQGLEEGAKPLRVDPREFFSRSEAAAETGGLKPLSYFGDDA